jgi:hypothetical protein
MGSHMSVARTRPLMALAVASGAVLALALLAAFRLGLAADLPTLLRANGPRVLLGLAAGAAFGLTAALQLELGPPRPLRDLQWLLAASAAAGGGVLLAWGRGGPAGVALFTGGGALAGALGWVLAGLLDRPRRWTNFGALAALVAAVILASIAGGYARARRDLTVPVALWLLGDLGRADAGPSLVLLAVVVAVAAAAGLSARSRWPGWALVAFGLGLGATGPLPFVGAFVARTVRRLAPDDSPRARLWATAGGSGAAVVAIDAVPRLLIGGYAFPFAVAAGMLAFPVFLGWNRGRLRALAGRRGRLFELGELALIVVVTAYAATLAYQLTRVVQQAT